MTKPIIYSEVTIPENVSPKKYHYTHRRAEILQFGIEAGHLDLLSRTELGKRYGKSKAQITHDINAIKEHLAIQQTGNDDVRVLSEMVFGKCIRELLKSGDWKGAADVTAKWNNWRFDVGLQERAADKHVVMNLHEQLDQPLTIDQQSQVMQLLEGVDD